MTYRRYAVFVCPGGALGAFGAAWLGWDSAAGEACAHQVLPGLPLPIEAITERPRNYGFHATLKPPFRLADGAEEQALSARLGMICRDQAPITLTGLRLERIGGFLALVPEGDTARLSDLAGKVVRGLDMFRAPPGEAELDRRRQTRLTPSQEANLVRWGYPYVMQDFRFHMTLTGSLPRAQSAGVMQVLARAIAPVLPRPYTIDRLSLLGEAEDGRFRRIADFMLQGDG